MTVIVASNASPISATLYLPGRFEGAYHLVFYRGTRYLLPPSLFGLLVECVAARFETDAGYLYRKDSVACDGNSNAAGTLLYRIRRRMVDDIIETHRCCLLLSVPQEEIRVSRAVFDLGPETIDHRILKRLRDALKDFLSCDARVTPR
jgi:hypothetical protein